MNRLTNQLRIKTLFACLLMVATLGACSDGSGDAIDSTGEFSVTVAPTDPIDGMLLTEGDSDGLSLDITIDRQEDFTAPISFSISGNTQSDVNLVTSAFSATSINASQSSTNLVIRLGIDDRPIMPQTRDFTLTATSGEQRINVPLSISIEPTSAPDIYLLAGQSNMVGFSGDGTRQAEPGGFDEPVDRIKQLNVSKNEDNEFLNASDYLSRSKNLVAPDVVTAMDPLHVPINPSNSSGKSEAYIGLGLSFAKRALQDTTAEIVLVPAAWSGSSFCANSNGPPGNWNAPPSSNPDLGNTWLFDRAVTRTNLAIEETGGILRGILWHQGESDANERCAPVYNDNVTLLVEQLRTQIALDARGPDARQADSNIPFVVGTMSHGNDSRDTSNFPYLPSKQSIDDAHRLLPSLVEHAALSNHDDLTPDNGFDCGNTSCIHFGPAALREMGSRYYDALLEASNR